jgi:alpha-1,3-mannosyl-glycoprotein beta-1,2-N-acetylglucosaminyltransferase
VIQTFEKKLREQRPTVPVVRLEHQQTGHQLNGYVSTCSVAPTITLSFRYQKLAAHYKFALDTIFEGLPEVKNAGITDVREVIILEDDLDIALDFYSFFDALAPILQHDESLLAVSAWNDNGMRGFVKDEKILYR